MCYDTQMPQYEINSKGGRHQNPKFNVSKFKVPIRRYVSPLTWNTCVYEIQKPNQLPFIRYICLMLNVECF